MQHKQAVRVRLDLKVAVSDKDVEGGNIVGEIPGGARKDEIVMVGAHFDSWHSGTGATDNGAGSAVMIEVMRILKALNLKLDRTVRLALWGGGGTGPPRSRAYVQPHFADPVTMALKAEHGKLSGTSTSITAAAGSAAYICRGTMRCARCSSNGLRRFAISA